MKIGIIGHFGGEENFNDGQTVKTTSLYYALKKNVANIEIETADTYYLVRKPLLFLTNFSRVIMRTDSIIVLLSRNGRKYLFPLLYVLARYFNKKIYVDCIGGNLAEEALNSKMVQHFLEAFSGIWTETYIEKSVLEELGTKAITIHNFKNIVPINEMELKYYINKIDRLDFYRLVLFSRIVKEKGIVDAIHSVKEVNRRLGAKIVLLDIYGPIGEQFNEEFSKEIEENKEFCSYKGVVEQDCSVEVLKEYYILLFPTYWKAEGLPGTIIDAYSAGLPVVARRWKYSDELIRDKETGYIYDNPEELSDYIEYCVKNRDEIKKIKVECRKESFKFIDKEVVPQILIAMGYK